MGQRIDGVVKITSADGLVVIVGPEGLTLAFSPEAAVLAGSGLIEHAAFARGATTVAAARRSSTR